MVDTLRALFVSFEAVPFAKVGGLADVAGALPDVLAEVGVDCGLVMPRFGDVDPDRFGLTPIPLPADWSVGIDFKAHPFRLWQGRLPKGARVWMIGDDHFFGRKGIYSGPDGRPFADELERHVFFAKAVVEMIKCLGLRLDVLHLNDWQTGPIASYLRRLYAHEEILEEIALCYSIHNMAYQGVFPAERLPTIGFDAELCRWPEPFECRGAVNFMKLGIVDSDMVTTVSPRYAEEIQTPEGGAGLDGLLRVHAGKLRGVLNGIDGEIWNPRTDAKIPYRFHAANLSGKRGTKAALLSECRISLERLDRPLIGMVGRLVAQKGLDVFLGAVEEMLGRDASLVILGTGAADIEEALKRVAQRHPDRCHVRIGFDDRLAHVITAAADFFVMPSRYEPCGLNQMYAMRYGAIPIVHRTGGLADTVVEWRPDDATGTGFLFDSPDAASLAAAYDRAIRAYFDPPVWKRLVQNAMATDFSWQRSAAAYREIYEEAIRRRRAALGR